MKKYGWEWRTEAGLKSWQGILFSILSDGGAIRNDLQKFVNFADQVIQNENCFPDSFLILTQLSEIYSMAGMFAAKDASLCQDLIARAQQASNMASKYIINDQLQDPEEVDEAVNKINLSHYYNTFCRIGMTKYLQSDCKDISYLQEIKPYYEKAIALSPDDDLLKFIGQQISNKPGDALVEPANGPSDYYEEFFRQGSLGLFSEKHYRAAIAAFQQAIAMRPKEALPRIRLSWVEMNIEGKTQTDIRRILKDLDFADSLLSESSFNNQADVDKAKCELQYVRGGCYFLLDENDKAAIYLKESLKLNPQMDLAEKLLKKISQNRNIGGATSDSHESKESVAGAASPAKEKKNLHKFAGAIILGLLLAYPLGFWGLVIGGIIGYVVVKKFDW
jgi:tetratricopeptide (TPR) repeat protein